MKAFAITVKKMPRWVREHGWSDSLRCSKRFSACLLRHLLPTVLMLICLGWLTLLALDWLEGHDADSNSPLSSQKQS